VLPPVLITILGNFYERFLKKYLVSEEHENGIEEAPKDEIDWNERAIGQKTWQRRQQSGEYETASISSSLFKKSKKNKKKNEERNERFEHGMIVYKRFHVIVKNTMVKIDHSR
jgi:hypothetical protein